MILVYFSLSAVILFLGHICFLAALIKFFGIGSLAARLVLVGIVFFLFASLILSSFLIHRFDNSWTRGYYLFAGVWAGLLVNLGLMMLVVLGIKYGGQAFGWHLPLAAARLILFGGASLLTIYGLYAAFSPRVVSYDLAIKDLPAAWEGKRVVQISDVHLGPVYRERFFDKLLGEINALEPAAVFITGDLFDGMESDFSWVDDSLSRLRAEKGVYYALGNHDLYLGFERTLSLLEGKGVKVLDNKLELVDGLQVIGIDYSFDKSFDLQAEILKQVGYDRTRPSILLFHEPTHIDLAKEAEIDLQLSGHTHNGQIFPGNYLADLAYRGRGYGLYQDGDFSLIVSRGAGTWGPPLRTTGHSEIVAITLHRK